MGWDAPRTTFNFIQHPVWPSFDDDKINRQPAANASQLTAPLAPIPIVAINHVPSKTTHQHNMGSFDRFLRKSAKKAYRSPRPIGRSKYAAPSKDAIIDQQQHEVSPNKTLEFGSGVFMMMQSETEDLLKQKNPCTSYDLALCFQQSEALRESIRGDKLLEELSTARGIAQDPWKDLLALLKRAQMSLQKRTPISSWPEAQTWLESELKVVARASETSETKDKSSLETFKLLIEKNSRKVMRKFRMHDLHKRLAARNSRIVHHRMIGTDAQALEDKEEEAYQDALHAAEEARIPPAAKEAEERARQEELEEEAQRIAATLLRPLTEDEQETVNNALYGIGPAAHVMAQSDSDIVVRESMHRLQPGQWLNDEVIHYFMVMLAKRDEQLSKADPSRSRSHFFKSFFITKLLNEGHANPDIEGTYEYRNVKRWSKKVPGKDIFKLDKIIIPINQGNAHWICGVIFMKEKRIQIYDSLGGSGRVYLNALFQYVQDEHKDKKKSPLPDIDEWTCVVTTRDTPTQQNGELIVVLYKIFSALACASVMLTS